MGERERIGGEGQRRGKVSRERKRRERREGGKENRERAVSFFLRKGSLQIKMTSFSCIGHLIPMNLQLKAEVADKRRAKRRYC